MASVPSRTSTPSTSSRRPVVAQGLGEVLLAGHRHRQAELPAERRGPLEEGDGEARSAADTAAASPAGPAPTTATRPRARGGRQHQRGLPAGPGFTRQDAFRLPKAWSRQAWLQAMQVLISSARPAGRLGHEVRVGQQRPGHRDQVGLPGGQDRLGQLGGVDPVRGADRHRHLGLEPGGRRAPGARRHLGDDRRHPRLVPADPGVEHADAGLLEQVRELDDLLPGLAALDEVEQRDPVDDRHVRADHLAGPAHDLDREAHPLRRRPAPGVGAVVGARGQELVDQVPLRAHDLDGVVPGPHRQPRRHARSRWPSGPRRGWTGRSAGTA